MVKRLFWIAVGVAIGIVAVSKAQAYVKANTPDSARQFLLGPDQDHVAVRTLEGLVNEFNGNGKVYIQTRNIHNLADALRPFFPSNTSN